MPATAPLSVSADAPQPRRLAVTRDALVIEGCDQARLAALLRDARCFAAGRCPR